MKHRLVPALFSQYISFGAIYLTVQNLPCEHRYKEENIILVGMIPGPKEPSLSINSYLSPLVEELKLGWDKGFVVRSPQNTLLTVRVDRQLWKEKHPNEDYFRVSATVCFDHFYLPSACSYLPVQRISSKYAHAIQPLTFNSVTENLFVACPLSFKYCIIMNMKLYLMQYRIFAINYHQFLTSYN